MDKVLVFIILVFINIIYIIGYFVRFFVFVEILSLRECMFNFLGYF